MACKSFGLEVCTAFCRLGHKFRSPVHEEWHCAIRYAARRQQLRHGSRRGRGQYAAVCTFVAGAYAAMTAIDASPALRNETVSRLASRTLTSPDEASPTLQLLFIIDITRKLVRLHTANWMLVYTFLLLITYVAISLFFALWDVQFPHYAPVWRNSAMFEAGRSVRGPVLAFLERHEEMRLFALYLRRPGTVLLFEAMNIIAIIQIIVFAVRVKYTLRNTEAAVLMAALSPQDCRNI